jgi:hypothetical protein
MPVGNVYDWAKLAAATKVQTTGEAIMIGVYFDRASNGTGGREATVVNEKMKQNDKITTVDCCRHRVGTLIRMMNQSSI